MDTTYRCTAVQVVDVASGDLKWEVAAFGPHLHTTPVESFITPGRAWQLRPERNGPISRPMWLPSCLGLVGQKCLKDWVCERSM